MTLCDLRKRIIWCESEVLSQKSKILSQKFKIIIHVFELKTFDLLLKLTNSNNSSTNRTCRGRYH